ncbi:hypothetical protein JAAARDRAFT_200374 [Jaapia argillacea MUCL 33604]|uniref:Uncharacterized protein n=1 Tax=Jaapia argillacea MUCL 33604 TaxID=933084 RepID=A0A067P5C8_9AGAM|nr:hypothetical protein JAAARDRAFT_200374 [Jaapia argillacea MUCL 33604]
MKTHDLNLKFTNYFPRADIHGRHFQRSSITESKHIPVVKKLWRRSNRNNPLGQMICTNIRLGKLAAVCVEFERRGMLESGSGLAEESGITEAVGMIDKPLSEDREVLDRMRRMWIVVRRLVLGWEQGKHTPARSIFSLMNSISHYSWNSSAVSLSINSIPTTRWTLPIFLSTNVPSYGRVSMFNNASATFYAPSERSGPAGMHKEIIQASPAWQQSYPRYDTVLVQHDVDATTTQYD